MTYMNIAGEKLCLFAICYYDTRNAPAGSAGHQQSALLLQSPASITKQPSLIVTKNVKWRYLNLIL